jgi:hypothetical protein
MRSICGVLLPALAVGLIVGCAGQVVPNTSYERAWAAARNAFLDQGVRVMGEERSTGTISGIKSGINLAAYVHNQADGSVRVEFRTVGATQVDPQLIERIYESYEKHMGR